MAKNTLSQKRRDLSVGKQNEWLIPPGKHKSEEKGLEAIQTNGLIPLN